MILPTWLTGFLDAHLRALLLMGRWRRLTERKDLKEVQTTLTVGLDVLDDITMPMGDLVLFLPKQCDYVSLINSNPSAVLLSEGKMVAAAGPDTAKQSSEVAFRCAGWLATGEDALLGPQLIVFRLVQSGSSGLLSDVREGSKMNLLSYLRYSWLLDCRNVRSMWFHVAL